MHIWAVFLFIFHLNSLTPTLPLGTCIFHNSEYVNHTFSNKITGYDKNNNYKTIYWYGEEYDILVGKNDRTPIDKTWVNAYWEVVDCDKLRDQK